MPPLHVQNFKYDKQFFLIIKSTSTFQLENIDLFSFVGCNSIIVSSKQRQEHNNLATIQRANLKAAHERHKSLKFVKLRTQMQTLTRMSKVVIEDYHHMTTMDEIVNWMKPIYLLSKTSLNLRAPFCSFIFTSKFFLAFLIMHTKKNNASPLCILYTLIP